MQTRRLHPHQEREKPFHSRHPPHGAVVVKGQGAALDCSSVATRRAATVPNGRCKPIRCECSREQGGTRLYSISFVLNLLRPGSQPLCPKYKALLDCERLSTLENARVSESKSRQITVEVVSKPPRRAVFANCYHVEAVRSHVIIHFGYRGQRIEADETVAACISQLDLRNQKASLEQYIEKVQPLVEDLEPIVSGGRFQPKTIVASNIVQVARTGDSAELSFCLYSIHEVVVPRKTSPTENLKAVPMLLVRSDLQMQYRLLCDLILAISDDESGS